MEACGLNNLLYYYTENDVSTKVRGRQEAVAQRCSVKNVFLEIS